MAINGTTAERVAQQLSNGLEQDAVVKRNGVCAAYDAADFQSESSGALSSGC